MSLPPLPNGLIAYGPDANCTLALCSIKYSVYRYVPSLSANTAFPVIFGIAMILHVAYGLKWREWFWTSAMALGCICEILGYAGRIMLHYNPFSFTGFMIQICCITFAPVFYCAAIYVTLTRITLALDPSISRIPPKAWYWLFLPCDLVSLCLQGTGGGMSSSSTGKSKAALNISIAGLSLQVITLFVFSVGVVDYAIRYARKAGRPKTTPRFKVFAACLAAAVVFIFIRCAYRIQELRRGYGSPLMADQGLFIGLEGVMIVLAVFVLLGAMPGPALQGLEAEVKERKLSGNTLEGGVTSDDEVAEKV